MKCSFLSNEIKWKKLKDTFYKIVQLLFCNDLPPLAKYSNNGWSAAADKKANV